MITITQKDVANQSQYILFDIRKLELNSYVPFDIYIKKDNGFVVIIKLGSFLSENIYNKLAKQDKLYIASESHAIKGLDCSSLVQYIQVNIHSNEKILDILYIIHKKNHTNLLEEKADEKTTNCLNNIVKAIIYIIKEKKDFIKSTMSDFSDSYSLERHSLHVALYAVNLGYLLDFNKEKLLQIGLAGLLHDLGFTTVDENILLKDSELASEELEIIHLHPEKSVAIAKRNFIHDADITDGIMHHHERYDGSGYPDSLFKNEISQYAAMIGICDVFDALTTNRPYRKKFTYFEALKFMIKDESMSKKFNRSYLQTFLKSLR